MLYDSFRICMPYVSNYVSLSSDTTCIAESATCFDGELRPHMFIRCGTAIPGESGFVSGSAKTSCLEQ